jgi:hypothetical protein
VTELSAPDGVTVAELVAAFEAEGFTATMAPRADGHIRCHTCGTELDAGRFGLHALGRTEGVSDPDDETVVAALICPVCSARGSLVLKYGPGASPEDATVEQHLAPPVG